MSGVSKVNKKSNLEKLLLELFLENKASEERPKVISVQSGDEIDTGEIISAPDSAQMDTEEAENLGIADQISNDIARAVDSMVPTPEQIENIIESIPDAEILQEKKKIDIDLIFEDSRGGIAEQIKIGEKIVQLVKAKTGKTVNFESNKAGSTLPDVKILDQRGNPIAQFESKSSKSANNEVSFFDQTLDVNVNREETFGPLLKLIAETNGLKFYQKTSKGTFEEIPPTKIYSDVSTLAHAMINQASKKGEKPRCGKYGELTAPIFGNDSGGFEYYNMSDAGYPDLWCSHEFDMFRDPKTGQQDVIFFKPNPMATQIHPDRIFFYEAKDDVEVYKYTTIVGKIKIKGKPYFWINKLNKRSAGDAGTLASECFRVNNMDSLPVERSAAIKQAASLIITDHLKEGGDHYFAVVKPENIYIFQTGLGNPLRLNAPLLGPEHFVTVGFGTYGVGGHNLIRMALKCRLNLNGVPTLDQLNIR